MSHKFFTRHDAFATEMLISVTKLGFSERTWGNELASYLHYPDFGDASMPFAMFYDGPEENQVEFFATREEALDAATNLPQTYGWDEDLASAAAPHIKSLVERFANVNALHAELQIREIEPYESGSIVLARYNPMNQIERTQAVPA